MKTCIHCGKPTKGRDEANRPSCWTHEAESPYDVMEVARERTDALVAAADRQDLADGMAHIYRGKH